MLVSIETLPIDKTPSVEIKKTELRQDNSKGRLGGRHNQF
jgi:hypothetical protein